MFGDLLVNFNDTPLGRTVIPVTGVLIGCFLVWLIRALLLDRYKKILLQNIQHWAPPSLSVTKRWWYKLNHLFNRFSQLNRPFIMSTHNSGLNASLSIRLPCPICHSNLISCLLLFISPYRSFCFKVCALRNIQLNRQYRSDSPIVSLCIPYSVWRLFRVLMLVMLVYPAN